MNFVILGVIFLVAVIGIIAVVYITKQSSIPDCSQTDGSSSGVATYKLNDDKSDCVPDTCASGYVLSNVQSTCVSTDCSKQDGTAVFVKSYKFDNTAFACVPDTCVDGSAPKNGVCPTPPTPPPPPSSVATQPYYSVAIPQVMKSPSNVYQLNFWADGKGTLVGLWDNNGKNYWSWGNGPNVAAAVNAYLAPDGTIGIYRQSDNYWLGTFGNAGPVDSSHAYNLILQDDSNLVVYPIVNGVWDSKKLWSRF